MPLWDNTYLNTLLEEAESYISTEIDCIFDRFSIPITTGISVYTLPSYVNRIIRVTWKGKKLWPLTFQEFCLLNPTSAVIDPSAVELSSSTPLYYIKHPTNFYDIRLYPTPSEDLAEISSNLFGSNIATGVIISCYRDQDNSVDSLHLPLYIIRRVKKAYLLSRAFAKEGKGQNLQASQYYEKKLSLLIEALKVINSNVFIGKTRVLNGAFNEGMYATPGRPVLPPDYPS
jgi:hypothetical protein